MKNILRSTHLLSLTALVATTAVAIFAGSAVSPLLLAIPFGAFVAGLFLSIMGEDYAKAPRGYEPTALKPILLPADDVFALEPAPSVTVESPVSWTARHRRTRRTIARV